MDKTAKSPHELVSQVTKLVSLPAVYFKVKELVDDPDASLVKIGEAISQDPALTMKLLRVANSAFFGFVAKVTTISRAVNLLGTQQVHDLALAASMAKAFEGISSEVMDMQRFWRHSIHCGVAARIIAVRCNVLDSERLFVEGLLRDIGHLVLYDRMPEEAREALARSRESGRALYQEERSLMGFDFAQVGAMLMAEWRLPESLRESVHYHPEPARAQNFQLETSILHIASRITDLAEAGVDPEEWPQLIDPYAWRTTGLSEDFIPIVIAEAEERTEETVELFFPHRRKSA